jgi:hypothetical protein
VKWRYDKNDLIGSIFVMFFYIVSIPMGTYCALFLADLFFMRMSYPDPLFTHHVINDVLSINISMCGDFVDHIYPIDLDIDTARFASYLDLHHQLTVHSG